MRKRDTFHVLCTVLAVVTDCLALFAGFVLAWWIRFESQIIPVTKGLMDLGGMYIYGACAATVIHLFIYAWLGMYRRPQSGSFIDTVPRLIRANLIGFLVALAFTGIRLTEIEYSRLTIGIALLTTTYLVVLVRYLVFQLEIRLAKMQKQPRRVLIIGTDNTAYRLRQGLDGDPRLNCRVVGFFPSNEKYPDLAIPPRLIFPKLEKMMEQIENRKVDEVILSDMSIPRSKTMSIISICEKHVVDFQLVPDVFRLLTSSVEVQNVNGVTLLGVGRWPLDRIWNRGVKRLEDIVGAAVFLPLAALIIGVAAVFIKKSSPGPVFYRQRRCGEGGRTFALFKLRTMPVNAESETGPVMTTEEDPRPTRVGRILRQYNIDELPQLWNVFRGDMSLVGPRPERPHFVEQFKENIGQYMWRHIYKPGMTGWAQVNGLRGKTSIENRIKYDLYYLENWSLAFDIKILLRTLFARENAY
jgi:exopolysaccharide biosynthesis polyprenyl glycosylphosphotransferase